MVDSARSPLRLDGREVRTNTELIDIYQRRISNLGFTGETMFYASEAQHQRKLAHFASLLHGLVQPQDSLLDIGCGYGSIVQALPPCRYIGIDLVPEFIVEAQAAYPDLE